MASDMLIARLEKRIETLEKENLELAEWKKEIQQEIDNIKGNNQHLIIRSELTLYTLSALITSGSLKGISIDQLIDDATFDPSDIGDDVIAKEKEIVATVLKKVKGL
ncbi:hypothetical protein PN657_004244 [Cronobacter dublinensis]|uniref:hypothetical protein n=1 Tax=Cronobacter dublinensis TaxID=413497 RepID=UPI0024AF28BA|nr:hypothetical protein [Cronobacter dublinensis]EKF2279070.1 hypothetical protein [Cronobacter dublinensis]EKF2293161.1 hypothetical protein [Cronobacter dublinensis]EKF2294696.1 hypothetical protein [Cronobacter dublinensis]EKF2296971.1 hypothetical protein [Cronobacter dublinensis]EKF2298992.1 hypothetical protein [Cronobacter dublinensis]